MFSRIRKSKKFALRSACIQTLESRLLMTNTAPIHLTVILRGQSNAYLFGAPYATYAFQGACNEAATLLGFTGKDSSGNNWINQIADATNNNDLNTIESGTAFISPPWGSGTGWVNPDSNGDGGWTDDPLETGMLNDLASYSTAVKSAPAAVVWLHNENDSENYTLTAPQWESAVRFDAAQVRATLGQPASAVPYIFVNAIPFAEAQQVAQVAIKTGMQALSDDSTFNAKIGAQFDDVNMDLYQPANTYGGEHMDNADAAVLKDRLAYSIADTFAQYALPGSIIANAGGHMDQLGPQVIQAATVSGNANQLLMTVSFDGSANALNPVLDSSAAAGAGWNLVTNTGTITKVNATAAQVVDASHILVTFASAVPTDGSMNAYYGYGNGRIALSGSDPGLGNGIYDNYTDSFNTEGFPIWTISTTGVPINAAAQQPESARVHGVSTNVVITSVPTIATQPSAAPSTVTGTTTALSVLGADTSPNGEAGLTYTWSVTSLLNGATAVTYNNTNGINSSKNIGVTFHSAGNYTFQVIVSNGVNAALASVSVAVNQTQTAFVVTPSTVSIAPKGQQQFNANWVDQFGNAMTTGTVTWSIASGIGSVSSSGLYTAPSTIGTATVQASVGGSTTATSAITVTSATGLPSGWVNANIGSPTTNGTATNPSLGGYTVTGAGTGLTASSDQFDYASGSVSANATIFARVTGVSSNNANGQVGVMLRDSTAVGSLFAMVAVTPTGVVQFESRAASGSNGASNASFSTGITPSATTPIWVKLSRSGTSYTASYATGAAQPTAWISLGSAQTITFTQSSYLAGLAVSSYNTGTLTTATYDNVTVNIGAPTVDTAAAASPSSTTGNFTALSVLGADNNGEPNLTYAWSYTGPTGVTYTNAVNGTNASKNITANFTQAGSYSFTATITNAMGLSTTSTVPVPVVVQQTAASLSVTLTSGVVPVGITQQYIATAVDQFGNDIVSPSVVWTISGSTNSISTTGRATFGSTPGAYTITATSGTTVGTEAVTVENFALANGSALGLNLSSAGPLTVTPNAGFITVSQNGIQITLTGFTTETVTDTGTNDVLNVNGTTSLPVTFVNAGTSVVNVNSGTLNFANANGTTASIGTLAVANNAIARMSETTAAISTLNLTSLKIAPNGVMDVANNQMFINYGTAADPVASIAAYLVYGENFGRWSGAGIDSSTANRHPLMTVGYLDSAGTIQVKYTYVGDANLDGRVDGSDYTLVDYGFDSSAKYFFNGDFNDDGVVNGSDYTLIDNAYNTESAPVAVAQATPDSLLAKTSSTGKVFAASPAAAVAASQQDIVTQLVNDSDSKHRVKHCSMEIFLNAN